MKSVNIRSLRHETGKLLKQVELGESVEIRRRNEPIAVIKPFEKQAKNPLPNFRSRLQTTYGDSTLEQTASELISEERGDR